VCFTVTVAGSDDVVVLLEVDPLEVDPLELEPPELDRLELDRRVVVVRGVEYVALPGAVAAGATTVGDVAAAARSAAEIESSVAWFCVANDRLSAALLSAFEHANAPRIAAVASKLRGLILAS
jgi:hypothetical protein